MPRYLSPALRGDQPSKSVGTSLRKLVGRYPNLSTAGAYTASGFIAEPGCRRTSVALLSPRRTSYSRPPTSARIAPEPFSTAHSAPWQRVPSAPSAGNSAASNMRCASDCSAASSSVYMR